MRKAPKGSPLHPIDAQINRIIAMVRARVEHPFRVIKRQFGHVKTRYRSLAKNRAQLFTLFALANLSMQAAISKRSQDTTVGLAFRLEVPRQEVV